MDSDDKLKLSMLILPRIKNNVKKFKEKWLIILLGIIEFISFFLIIFCNFMGWSISYSFYFSSILCIFHGFSWMGAIACYEENYSFKFCESIIILYGVNIILDLIASIWKIVEFINCSSTVTQWCVDFLFLDWMLSGFPTFILLVIDVVMIFLIMRISRVMLDGFISINNAVKELREFETNLRYSNVGNSQLIQLQQTDSSLNKKKLVDPNNLEKILLLDINILLTTHISINFFKWRYLIIFACFLEPAIFYVLVIFNFLGLVIDTAFYWSIFLNFLHLFTWIMSISCIYDNFSLGFISATIWFYILNITLDSCAFIYRFIDLLGCNPITNVDCNAFRYFPGWLPMEFLSGVLLLLDFVLLMTLAWLYFWIKHEILEPVRDAVDMLGKDIVQYRQEQIEMNYLNKKNNNNDSNNNNNNNKNNNSKNNNNSKKEKKIHTKKVN